MWCFEKCIFVLDFYGFPCCLGVGKGRRCHVLARMIREIEILTILLIREREAV